MHQVLNAIFVGLDVHQKTIALAAYSEDGEHPILEKTYATHDLSELRKTLRRLSEKGSVHACYEASGSGFELQRAIIQWGHLCQVIAPTLIPTKPGDRRKNDRLDARRLARLYRAGELTPIHIPGDREESIRSFVRYRTMTSQDLTRAKNRVHKFLQFNGFVYTGKTRWTDEYWRWLGKIELPQALDREILAELIDRVDYLGNRLKALERRIEELGREPECQSAVDVYSCFSGIDCQSAMVLHTELGNLAERFGSPKQLMAYLGLTPSEHSSGNNERRGSIRKNGNARCRHILVQAAWKYMSTPKVGRLLAKRQKNAPAWLTSIARKALHRLHKRFWYLALKLNSNQKAIVAVARELAGFLWAARRKAVELSAHQLVA